LSVATEQTDFSEPKAKTGPKADRFVIYDFLKIFAALGITMFHADTNGPLAWFWGSGLVIFLFFIGFAPGKDKGVGDYLRTRSYRLLMPWAVWSVAYWLLHLVRGTVWIPGVTVDISRLLVGTSVHLWFLPFAFIAGLLLLLVRRTGYDNFWATLALFSVVVAACLIAAGPLDGFEPIRQWVLSMPVLLVGAFARSWSHDAGKVLIIMLGSVAVAAVGTFMGVEGLNTGLVGLTLCTIALAYRGPVIPLLQRLGNLIMGIYLIHVAMLLVVYKFLPQVAANPLTLGAAAFLMSAGAVAVIRLHPLGRQIT